MQCTTLTECGYETTEEHLQTWWRSAKSEEYCRQRNSTSISTMWEAEVRAGMEALTARLMQAVRVLMDTRQQVEAALKVTAPLVDARTTGKAPTLTVCNSTSTQGAGGSPTSARVSCGSSHFGVETGGGSRRESMLHARITDHIPEHDVAASFGCHNSSEFNCSRSLLLIAQLEWQSPFRPFSASCEPYPLKMSLMRPHITMIQWPTQMLLRLQFISSSKVLICVFWKLSGFH